MQEEISRFLAMASMKSETKDVFIDFWLRTVSYGADCSEQSGDKKGSNAQVFNLFEWLDISIVIWHYKITKNQPLVQVFRLKNTLKNTFFKAFSQSQRTDCIQ